MSVKSILEQLRAKQEDTGVAIVLGESNNGDNTPEPEDAILDAELTPDILKAMEEADAAPPSEEELMEIMDDFDIGLYDLIDLASLAYAPMSEEEFDEALANWGGEADLSEEEEDDADDAGDVETQTEDSDETLDEAKRVGRGGRKKKKKDAPKKDDKKAKAGSGAKAAKAAKAAKKSGGGKSGGGKSGGGGGGGGAMFKPEYRGTHYRDKTGKAHPRRDPKTGEKAKTGFDKYYNRDAFNQVFATNLFARKAKPPKEMRTPRGNRINLKHYTPSGFWGCVRKIIKGGVIKKVKRPDKYGTGKGGKVFAARALCAMIASMGPGKVKRPKPMMKKWRDTFAKWRQSKYKGPHPYKGSKEMKKTWPGLKKGGYTGTKFKGHSPSYQAAGTGEPNPADILIEGLAQYFPEAEEIEKILGVIDIYMEGRLSEDEFDAYLERKMEAAGIEDEETAEVLEAIKSLSSEMALIEDGVELELESGQAPDDEEDPEDEEEDLEEEGVTEKTKEDPEDSEDEDSEEEEDDMEDEEED